MSASILFQFKNSHGTQITDWECECGGTFSTSARSGDATCCKCDQPYNCFGQKVNLDFNASTRSEDISDLAY